MAVLYAVDGTCRKITLETAWTRALCRAIIGLVGMGDKIDADEDPVDTRTGEMLTPPGQSDNFIESTGDKTPEPPQPPLSRTRSGAGRAEHPGRAEEVRCQ